TTGSATLRGQHRLAPPAFDNRAPRAVGLPHRERMPFVSTTRGARGDPADESEDEEGPGKARGESGAGPPPRGRRREAPSTTKGEDARRSRAGGGQTRAGDGQGKRREGEGSVDGRRRAVQVRSAGEPGRRGEHGGGGGEGRAEQHVDEDVR